MYDESPSGYKSCPSHCCTRHGCKYGYKMCPVDRGVVEPEYPNNNGCEYCEDDPPPPTEVDRAIFAYLPDKPGAYKYKTLIFMSDGSVRWEE